MDLAKNGFSKKGQGQRRKGKKGNRNKRKGTNFEYRVGAFYRKKGFTVLRARGSLGPADLLCLRRGERDVAIQCKDIKSNYFDSNEMSNFVSWCNEFNKCCIWAYNYHGIGKKNGRMKFIDLETTPVSSIDSKIYAQ